MQYEWVPDLCTICERFSHKSKTCIAEMVNVPKSITEIVEIDCEKGELGENKGTNRKDEEFHVVLLDRNQGEEKGLRSRGNSSTGKKDIGQLSNNIDVYSFEKQGDNMECPVVATSSCCDIGRKTVVQKVPQGGG